MQLFLKNLILPTVLAMFFIFTAGCLSEGDEDNNSCINKDDCPSGWICDNGVCRNPEASSDNDFSNTGDTGDTGDTGNTGDTGDTSNTGESDNDYADEDVEEFDDEVSDEDGQEEDKPVECEEGVTCNGRGICYIKGGYAACDCYTGYTGEYCEECQDGFHEEEIDEKKVCMENESCSEGFCNGRGECDDSEGTAVCNCFDEYKGEKCEECADGYQDNDDDGACRETCETADLSCEAPSVCRDDSGTAECDCEYGYAGENCDQCASGFMDDGSGNCIPEEKCADNPGWCHENGICMDYTGTLECDCDTGYAGNRCEFCASEYQDSNGDGNCLEDCEESCGQSGGFINMESHGSCQYDGSGHASCVCDPGWKTPVVIMPPFILECSECDRYNPPDEYSEKGCPANCQSDGEYDLCGEQGECYYDKENGKKYCICDSGYKLENGDKYEDFCVSE